MYRGFSLNKWLLLIYISNLVVMTWLPSVLDFCAVLHSSPVTPVMWRAVVLHSLYSYRDNYLQSLHCESVLAIISLILINRQVICFREPYTTPFLLTLSCQSISISSYFRHFKCFILAICSFLSVQFSFVHNQCKKKLASSITSCTAQIHFCILFMALVFVCLHGGMPVSVSLLIVNRHVLRGKSLNKLMGGKGRGK